MKLSKSELKYAVRRMRKLVNSLEYPVLPGFPHIDGEPAIEKSAMEAGVYLGIELGLKFADKRKNTKREKSSK